MKILLLGANGQLGWQLRRSLCMLGELTALTRHSSPWCGDLSDAGRLAATVRDLQPDVIVNAAAYTAVDKAEAEPAIAYAVNHEACETLAREAARLGAWLIHYSTEYVFDGSGDKPWRETDATAPLNVYGQSKLAGEKAIGALCPRHLILRTSWLFDSWGDNFLKSILSAAATRETLDVVSDQWGAPTRAALVADVTAHLLPQLAPATAGTYHVAAAGETNRHAFATFGLECALARGFALKAGPRDLRPVASSAYLSAADLSSADVSAARRPANSRLDTERLRHAFGLVLPPWQQGVDAVVAELGMTAYTTAAKPAAS